MKVYKSSEEEFSASSPVKRLAKLKWWFLLLLLLGILAALYVILTRGGEAVEQFKGAAVLVTQVYAQPASGSVEKDFTPKALVMAGVFAILGIVYLAGIFKLFFSKNPKGVDAAADIVKTLTGFFVGAGTGFLG